MHSLLEEYRNLAAFLRKSLGNLYEVFLLEYAGNTLKPAESDYVDSEDSGSCIHLVLEGIQHQKMFLNQIIETKSGKINRVSVRMICDGNGDVIGALCILLQCSPFLKLTGLANDFLRCETWCGEQTEGKGKTYPPTLAGIEAYIADYAMQSSKPTRNERTEIICDLYDMGMFQIKGAVAKAAGMLQMSAKSVYRYVKEIRDARG